MTASTQAFRIDSSTSSSDHPITRIRAQLVKVAVVSGAAQAPPSLLTRAVVELAAHDQQVASTVTAAFDAMRAHYAACIAEAQTAGEIDTAADAD